jgi:CubicO group peptidase (beta-lactamase class C family)
MVRAFRQITAYLLVSIFLFSSTLSAYAASDPDAVPAVPLTKETIAEFVDTFAHEQMAIHDIPGMLVSAVLHDQIVFSKGYGYADIASQRPMDPDQSIFRAASLSKLFTAAALLQLSEQGLIDLHADINKYLVGMQIPDTYPQPISVGHLLTHTSGFDELSLAVRFDNSGEIKPLYEDVSSSMPPRVRPPGEILTYSNYGYSLAGYVLESVTGMMFEDYVDTHIFKPLGMASSSFQEPPPAGFTQSLVTMYTPGGDQQIELPRLYNNLRPSGSVYSTIEDLARFAAAQLNNGRHGDKTILRPESLALMQNPQFSHHPDLEGWGYGFMEFNNRGMSIIGHGGDFNGSHTILFLVPAADFGMVLHYNTNLNAAYENEPRAKAIDTFIDKFFPDLSLSRPPAGEFLVKEITNLSGYYQTTRYPQKSPGKYLMPNIFAQLIVTQDERGHVSISMPMGMVEPTEWIPYTHDLFVRADRETFLSYQLNERGKVEYLFYNMGGAGATTIERVNWYGIYWVIFGFIGFSLLVFVITLFNGLIRMFVSLVRQRQNITPTLTSRRALGTALSISIFGLTCAVLIGVMTVHVLATHNSPLLFLLPVISLMGWLIGIASIILAVFTGQMWKSRESSFFNRLLLSLTPLAGLVFTWVLYYGNMLRFTTFS